MKLEWMGAYRSMIEKLIRYCNIYAQVCNKELEMVPKECSFSFAQIQVVEYLLENEDLHQNMSEIAHRLGILPGTFSKLVSKLVSKGMLEKYHAEGNLKEVIVQVSEHGREVYGKYSELILERHFSKMFAEADKLSPEQVAIVAAMLEAPYKNVITETVEKPPKLIKIPHNDKKKAHSEK